MSIAEHSLPSRTLAAQYVRMSTEHQRYSTESQKATIAQFAARRGFEVVRTYEDKGRSGLRLQGRPGLQQLLRDVLQSNPGFEVVLVYDVSRWGRFQDADESAYYEYHCRRVGIGVVYCTEVFENDGSMSSAIMKTLKRAMAGEYSRELSSKVFRAHCQQARKGFWQGGGASFGFRRMAISQDGVSKFLLRPGEQKNLQSDKVVLVAGPEREVRAVQFAFEAFADKGWTEVAIAAELNRRGHRLPNGSSWTRRSVHFLLSNEKYAGVGVYNRTTSRLASRKQSNPKEQWVRQLDAHEPLITRALYARAEARIRARAYHSDDELIQNLLRVLKRHGRITPSLLDQAPSCATYDCYRRRFGSIRPLYTAIGYRSPKDDRWIEANKRCAVLRRKVSAMLVEICAAAGLRWALSDEGDILTVNGAYDIAICVLRAQHKGDKPPYWMLNFRQGCYLHLAVRLTPDNEHIQDAFLVPHRREWKHRIRLNEATQRWLARCRLSGFEDLGAWLPVADPRRQLRMRLAGYFTRASTPRVKRVALARHAS